MNTVLVLRAIYGHLAGTPFNPHLFGKHQSTSRIKSHMRAHAVPQHMAYGPKENRHSMVWGCNAAGCFSDFVRCLASVR